MKKKVHFISLGCDKNLVDSEKMLNLLQKEGYEFTDDETEAEIIIINSCCFIGDAKEESINTIIETGALKTIPHAKLKWILLAGCLAERYSDEIGKELPEVDAIIGTASYDRLCEVIKELEDREKGLSKTIPNKEAFEKAPESNLIIFKDKLDRLPIERDRILTSGGHYAYLKIAEGCDKCCTYCIIPHVRGHYRSIPMDELVREAEQLAADGVKELILVAQETTVYGTDIYGEKRLPELLHRLCEIPGIVWIRLLYAYPEEVDERLIEAMRTEPKIVHYIDLPVQHSSDLILKKMGRKTTLESIKSTIGALRAAMPDIAIRTTLISGFPGESEEQHEDMLSFIKDMRFDRLGVFPFSPEEGTPAALFDDQFSEEIKKKRADSCMEVQQEIAFDIAEAQKGKEVDVLIEGRIPEENVYVGRTYRDAPNVDGLIFLNTGEKKDSESHGRLEYMTGVFVRARITGGRGYDVIGEIL
ncbi:MAG: 30S ribosomal protein S12 methylthiotransferase RimO [Lachnospiraceae bacterium]|nr:30S ribosomal protein S12 methylthiotransferase RimO [Lachnospiraceae bacterium]